MNTNTLKRLTPATVTEVIPHPGGGYHGFAKGKDYHGNTVEIYFNSKTLNRRSDIDGILPNGSVPVNPTDIPKTGKTFTGITYEGSQGHFFKWWLPANEKFELLRTLLTTPVNESSKKEKLKKLAKTSDLYFTLAALVFVYNDIETLAEMQGTNRQMEHEVSRFTLFYRRADVWEAFVRECLARQIPVKAKRELEINNVTRAFLALSRQAAA